MFFNVEVLVKAFNDEMEKISNKDSLKEWQRISASIGYAIYDDKLDDGYDSVFARADKAMYDRKKEMKGLRED